MKHVQEVFHSKYAMRLEEWQISHHLQKWTMQQPQIIVYILVLWSEHLACVWSEFDPVQYLQTSCIRCCNLWLLVIHIHIYRGPIATQLGAHRNLHRKMIYEARNTVWAVSPTSKDHDMYNTMYTNLSDATAFDHVVHFGLLVRESTYHAFGTASNPASNYRHHSHQFSRTFQIKITNLLFILFSESNTVYQMQHHLLTWKMQGLKKVFYASVMK